MKTKFNLAAVVWCNLLYAGLLLIFNSCATPDLSNNILRRIKFENKKKQENMILKLTFKKKKKSAFKVATKKLSFF